MDRSPYSSRYWCNCLFPPDRTCTAPHHADTYIEIAVSVREGFGSSVKTLVTKLTCSVARKAGLLIAVVWPPLLARPHAAELPVAVSVVN